MHATRFLHATRFRTLIRAGAAVLTLAAVASPAAPAAAAAPTKLLTSVVTIDAGGHTGVFPLHRGSAAGRTVWYVLTDVSDAKMAAARGLIFAPALAAVGTIQSVTVRDGVWSFAGAPDFSAARVFRAGPGGFPPAAATPGASATGAYLPFVRIAGSSVVYNAPIVATGDGPFDVTRHTNTADRVLALDPVRGTVTLLLADGYAGGKRVLYISTEASDPGVATIERATYVPALANAARAARLPIDVIANGATGVANAQAQGLGFVALNGGLDHDATAANAATLRTSLNILGGVPARTASGNGVYSPLWDVSVGAWTAAATKAGRVRLLTSSAAVEAAVAAHELTGPGGKPFGPVGFAVNCPVVAIFK
jgi:hypothetical protein